jgi:uncharacterized lipoprotein NlpE involved in copper resistance
LHLYSLIHIKTILVSLLLSGLFLNSCINAADKEETTSQITDNTIDVASNYIPDTIHTSQNSLDWAGLYQGEIPCADCSGIATTIVISDIDSSSQIHPQYQQRQQYLGKSDAYFLEEGSIEWLENGSIIKLIPNSLGKKILNQTSYFKVVENALVMLDIEGKPIESSFSEKYRLPKTVDKRAFPAFVSKNLADDYSSIYQITPLKWVQNENSIHHITEWNMEEGYLIAQNDISNEYAPGKWTRIDWVDLDSVQIPYQWAFCLISYKEDAYLTAKTNNIANKNSLINGCNGFPFTRLKLVKH